MITLDELLEECTMTHLFFIYFKKILFTDCFHGSCLEGFINKNNTKSNLPKRIAKINFDAEVALPPACTVHFNLEMTIVSSTCCKCTNGKNLRKNTHTHKKKRKRKPLNYNLCTWNQHTSNHCMRTVYCIMNEHQ